MGNRRREREGEKT
jgi:hypothetical protein